MVMRIHLRRLVSAVLPLMVTGMAAGIAAPQNAGAASRRPASPAVSADYSCVLRGGQAYCWGNNRSGQLGDGTSVESDVPIAVRHKRRAGG